METIVWILQVLVAAIFLFSGVNKSFLAEKRLVEKGQTGVEGLPLWLIRFIGITEILGAIGLVLPRWLAILPILTPIAAICFAIIMVLAAMTHARRKEYKVVALNLGILLICAWLAWQLL